MLLSFVISEYFRLKSAAIKLGRYTVRTDIHLDIRIGVHFVQLIPS